MWTIKVCQIHRWISTLSESRSPYNETGPNPCILSHDWTQSLLINTSHQSPMLLAFSWSDSLSSSAKIFVWRNLVSKSMSGNRVWYGSTCTLLSDFAGAEMHGLNRLPIAVLGLCFQAQYCPEGLNRRHIHVGLSNLPLAHSYTTAGVKVVAGFMAATQMLGRDPICARLYVKAVRSDLLALYRGVPCGQLGAQRRNEDQIALDLTLQPVGDRSLSRPDRNRGVDGRNVIVIRPGVGIISGQRQDPGWRGPMSS